MRRIARQSGIDGLRSIACLGIVMMHVLVNGGYSLPMDCLNRFIGSFTDFVFLFMVISGYAMCCGYYEKFMTQRSSMEDFYRRRYFRIFPFFAFLVLLDVLLAPSKAALCEAFADLTLSFGFFAEKEISVIGVGWYLGTTFVFYLVFPFFCVLLKKQKTRMGGHARLYFVEFGVSRLFPAFQNKFCILFLLFSGRRVDLSVSE